MCDCRKTKREEINSLRSELDRLKEQVKGLQEALNKHSAHPYPYSTYYHYNPYPYTTYTISSTGGTGGGYTTTNGGSSES